MKFVYWLTVCCAVALAKHHGTRRNPPTQPANLRRARRIPAPPRKLGEEEVTSDNFVPVPVEQQQQQQQPQQGLGLSNIFPRVFGNIPTELAGFFSAPRGLINGLVGGTPSLLGGTEMNLENSATGLGELVDKTRNVAGTGFDTIEMITSGLAQKGRSAVDRATNKAVGLMGSGLSLGTNGVESSAQAVRSLQGEAKRVVSAAILPQQ